VSAHHLVTGATGFIGREVVARLLAAGRPVAVLARGRDGVDARARVAAALGGTAGLERVEIVEGDLAAPGAGLDPADVDWLRERVETVIHCAGDTSFVPEALEPFVAGHVEGPVALLQALAGGRLARWAHVSTAFVCGNRSGTVRESDGDVGQAFHNTYERVKLAAETAVREAGRRAGVDVRVLRPSIVVGAAPPTAGGNPSNLFFTFIRLLAALAQWPTAAPLRIEAAPRAAFNIVPLDYVAAATIALASQAAADGGTFHLVVRDAPSQAAMLAMLVEHLGARGLTLVDAGDAPLADPSPLERRVARMLEPYRAYLTQDVRFDDAAAATTLAASGVTRPLLTPAEVHRLIELALNGRTPANVEAPAVVVTSANVVTPGGGR
jgi:thioester reductase-like protein